MLIPFINPADFAYKNFIKKGQEIKSYKELLLEIEMFLSFFSKSKGIWTVCFSPILPFTHITSAEKQRIHTDHEVMLSLLNWNVLSFLSLENVCCELNKVLDLGNDPTRALEDCFIPLIDSGFFGKIHFSQPVQNVLFLNELRIHVQLKNIRHENLYV